MSKMTPTKRTFAAKRHPKGSPERAMLNTLVETSEYYPSQPWLVRIGTVAYTFRTQAEANAKAQQLTHERNDR